MPVETRVLHIAETLIGGIASHIEDVVLDQIQRYGVDSVTLLVPRQHRGFIPAVPDTCIHTFERERRGPIASLRLLATSNRLLRSRRPRIVHLHSSVAGGVVRLFRMFAPSQPGKLIYCPHGWAFATDAAQLKRLSYAAAERLLALVTSAIITVSEHETQLGRRHGIPSRLMTTIYNGVASVEADAAADPLPMSRSTLNLLFVGRLDRQKGFNHLLQAARELQGLPIQFHVCGSPVVSSLHDYGSIPSNVTLHGWVKRETVLATMRQADALVLPSLWEGLSITGIEALRAGLPIIASNRSSNPELVEHGTNGLLVELDEPSGLAVALRSLSRESLREMGARGRERFARQFTLEQQVEKLSHIYEVADAH